MPGGGYGAGQFRVCRVCGSDESVHRGTCLRCRRALLRPEVPLGRVEHGERASRAAPVR